MTWLICKKQVFLLKQLIFSDVDFYGDKTILFFFSIVNVLSGKFSKIT